MCKWGTDKEINLCEPRENGMKTAKVDACTAPLVQMLNDYKIKTLGSCCGHGKIKNAGIMIDEKHISIENIEGFGKKFKRIIIKFPYPGDK